jgi:hypothetical protein
LLLDQWLRAPRASAPRNIVIETLDYGGVVIGHWKLNAAFPEQAPVRRMGEDRLMTSIVSFEVTHRGLLRN